MFILTMQPRDQAEESRRLGELYAQMSDGELRALAERINDLTDTAQSALRAEVSRRGLGTEDGDGVAYDPAQFDDSLADLWRAKDIPEAKFVKGILDSAGIASAVVSDDVQSGGFPEADSAGEAIIRVAKSDLNRALKAIGPYFPQDPPDVKEYVVRCPKCDSRDIVLQAVDLESAKSAVANSKFNWTCDACGHQWKDDGIAEDV